MKKNILYIALLALISLVSCEETIKREIETEAAQGNKFEAVIPETTKVVSSDEFDEKINLNADSDELTMSNDLFQKLELNEGDVLVSSSGEGFLKKVKSFQVNGGEVQIVYEDASLEEAVQEMDISFDIPLNEEDIAKTVHMQEGVFMMRLKSENTEEKPLLGYKLDKVYLDDDKLLMLDGIIELEPLIRSELKIKHLSLQKFSTDFNFGIEAKLGVKSTLAKGEIVKEKTLVSQNFSPKVIIVGGVPLVIVPNLTVVAGAKLEAESKLGAETTVSTNFTAGILYEDGNWSTHSEFEKTFEFIPPTLTGQLEAEVYVKPILKLKLYGTVAPYMYGKLFTKYDAEVQMTGSYGYEWALSAGASIGGGAEVSVLSKVIAKYESDFFTFDVPLADSETYEGNLPPEVSTSPIPENTSSINISDGFKLEWECLDRNEDDKLAFKVYLGSEVGQLNLIGETDSKFFIPQLSMDLGKIYYWQIKATDEEGEDSLSEVWKFKTIDNGVNLSKGLVAYYPFNGNANDESGNGNHGVTNGVNLTFDHKGIADNAYYFEGNYGKSFIKIPQNSTLQLQDHSISAYVKWEGKDTYGHNFGGIFSNGYNCDHYSLVAGGSLVKSFVNYPNSSKSDQTFSTEDLTDNLFHHVVATFDGSVRRLYLDGELVGEMEFVEQIDYSTEEESFIGVNFPGGDDTFKGIIDEVRVYSRAINSSEVNLLNDELQTNINTIDIKKGLLAYYSFDGDCNDKSGNGNDAISNSATFDLDAKGNANSAYLFDGTDDYIELPKMINSSGSISMFFKASGLSTSDQVDNRSYLFSHFQVGGDNDRIYIMQQDQKLQYGIDENAIINTSYILSQEWTHVVLTWHESKARLYINNKLINESDFNSISYSEIAHLGSYKGYKDFFKGSLDEVRVYNRPITEEEISILYNI